MLSFTESYLLLFNPWGDWSFVTTWPRTPFTSTITGTAFWGEQELVAQEKIIELIRNRSLNKQKLWISTVRDPREDQPAASLQVGSSRSLSVCRIARHFPRKNFQIFIEALLENLARKPEIAKNFDSIAKLKEIFLIPDKIADEIFATKEFKDDDKKLIDKALKDDEDRKATEVYDSFEKLKEKLLAPYKARGVDHSLEYSKILLKAFRDLTEDQLAKLNPIPVGSGFLVGATHLLTNYHVLPDEEVARQCVAQFNYEGSQGAIQRTEDYELDPNALFIREPSLDYTLVQLKFSQLTRQAGHNFGWLQLVESDSNVIPDISHDSYIIAQLEKEDYRLSEEEKKGDNVILIHHPKGRQKKVDLTNNRVIPNGLYKDFLRYQGESDYGSSGCPVFNTRWELVALNHAAIVQADGTFIKQGVRVRAIVADLKQKATFIPKLKSFIEDFVVTSERLVYPALPAALEFDGETTYVDCGKDESLVISQAVTVEAWVRNNDPNSDGVIVHRGGSFDNPGYCIWRYNNRIRVELQDNIKGKIIVDTVDTALDDQSWHHIAFTWDTEKKWKQIEGWEQSKGNKDIWKKIAGVTIYIDGEVKPIETPLRDLKDGFNLDNIGSPAMGLTIGRSESIENLIEKIINGLKENSFLQGYFHQTRANLRLELARQYYFNGSITEVRLWNVTRTQDQIKENRFRRLSKYDSEQDWSNLAGYWRPEEIIDNEVCNLKFENLRPTDFNPSFPPNFGLRLHGLGEYIDCGKLNYEKNIAALTVEAWVKNMGGDSDGMIVHQGGGWREDGFSIWKRKESLRVELQNSQTHQKITIDAKISSEASKGILTESPPQWHHVAFTWKKDSDISVYIDGEIAKETTVVLSENCKSASDFSSVGIPKVNLNLGRSQNHGRYFNGCIAEVRIWDAARTQDQIQKNMSRRLNDDELKDDEELKRELIGYWFLDQKYGDRDINRSPTKQYGYGTYGIVFGRRWERAYTLLEGNQGAYGVVSKAQTIKASQYPASPLPFGLIFSESSHCVKCCFQHSKAQNLALKVTDGITVEAWVKHNFGSSSIVKQRNNQGYGYSLVWYEGKLQVKLQAEKEGIVVYTEENFPNDHLWHHVAFTWGRDKQDHNSHEISIYIDGRLQNCVVEGNCKTVISTMQTKSIGIFKSSLEFLENPPIPLIVGGTEQETDYYNMAIAEVRLWNVARTQDQIQKNMSRRLSQQVSEQDSEQCWSTLVGYWRLDEVSEDKKLAFDQSNNKNHGTICGATGFPELSP
ncbi:LamG-like jellyroll fold domain-containing protein [Egbenema bharatensis]|uniref:LamG-like jellyroll fold domain-containing protein n=1 Tax=Egbenema bharatensis TaxID=3463334 RepID=UPI003A8B3EB5